MGLVRFELTIDGSLRKCQVFGIRYEHKFSAPTVPHCLPRQVCSADPLLIITYSAGARRHAGLGHSPGIAILYAVAIKTI